MRRILLWLAVAALALAVAAPVLAATTYSGTATVKLVEIFPGIPMGSKRIGATFVGWSQKATGNLPSGPVRVSVSYDCGAANPTCEHIGTFAIIGGSWTLTDSKTWGRVYGKVLPGGTIAWLDSDHASVSAALSVTGGTGKYSGATNWDGADSFSGLLNETTFPPTVAGTLTLSFQVP